MDLLSSDVPGWFIGLAAFVFGASWGSFFNVAIYRWPRGLSVVTPPSQCPSCDKPIPGYLNLPILGYLVLRGRTACCGTRLSPRYPMVELISALLCVAIAQRYISAAPEGTTLVHAALVALSYFIFVGGLVIITFVDLDFMEIPDEVSLPGAALGLATASLREWPGVEAAALGAGGAFLVTQLLFVWTYELFTGRRGMGEGDPKLLLMIGAFIGWQGALFSLMAGAAQGLVAALYARLSGRTLGPDQDDEDEDEDEATASAAADPDAAGSDGSDPRDAGLYLDEPPPAYIGHLRVPFGPFLALGAVEYLFFGETLVDAWLRFVGSVSPL